MKQVLIAISIAVVAIGAIYIFGMQGGENQNLESTRFSDQARAVEEPENDMQKENMQKEPNIIEIAVADQRFTTLVTAVQEAGLVETLSGEGPFTVFAPTNDAFAKLPEGTLSEVLANKDQLTSILTYHVVAGRVMASDVVNLTSAETIQGGDLTIQVTGNEVMINNAKVIITDIEASNGVIHVIDTVLIPQ